MALVSPLISNENSDSFAHACHNEKCCYYLNASEENEFFDWVVTTAFSSALHFVRSIAFPNYKSSFNDKNGKKIKFHDFDSYKYAKMRSEKRITPHDIMIEIAVDVLKNDDLHQEYSSLYNLSRTARYDNYQINKAARDACLKNL